MNAVLAQVLKQKFRLITTFKSSSRHSPLMIFSKVLVIAGVSLLLSLVIPAVIAYRHDVFYQEGVRRKLPPDAKQKMEDYEGKLRGLKAQLQILDKHILDSAEDEQPEHRNQLLELRTKLASYIDNYAPPVSIFPFYLSPQMLLWPGIYTALGNPCCSMCS